jgi:hypothetical protein
LLSHEALGCGTSSCCILTMIGCLRYVAYRILAAATVDWSSVCPFDLRVLLSETLLRAGLRLAGGSELGSAASASQSSSALVKPTELQLQLSTEQIAARKQAVVKMLRKVRDLLVLGFAVLCNCTPMPMQWSRGFWGMPIPIRSLLVNLIYLAHFRSHVSLLDEFAMTVNALCCGFLPSTASHSIHRRASAGTGTAASRRWQR